MDTLIFEQLGPMCTAADLEYAVDHNTVLLVTIKRHNMLTDKRFGWWVGMMHAANQISSGGWNWSPQIHDNRLTVLQKLFSDDVALSIVIMKLEESGIRKAEIIGGL